MSVDIIESITIPPLKRLRSSSESNTSKCGEVFVTNCADKWTFYCSHCQLSTTDIGVFVCHIRLQHLNQQQQQQTPAQETPQNDTPITIASSRQNVAVLTPTPPPPMTSIPRDNLIVPEIVTAKEPENEQMQSDIVKEEPTVSMNQSNMDYEAICSKVSKIVDISTLTQPESNNETTADVPSDKNTHPQENSNQLLFPMPIVKQESEPIINGNITNIVNVNKLQNNNTNETISRENDEEVTHEAINDILKRQSEKRNKTIKDKKQHVLQKNFKTYRQKLSLKCGKCKTSFNTRTGLLVHLTTHSKNKHIEEGMNENIMNLRPRKSNMSAIDEPNMSPSEAQDNRQQLPGKTDPKVTDKVKPANNENDEQVNDSNMETCDSLNEEEYEDEMPAHSSNKGKKPSIRKIRILSRHDFKCLICKKKFRNKLKQLEHMKRHRRGKNTSVKCRECNKVFASINGLRAHLRFHSNLTCPICEQETTPHFFIKHVLTHESDGCYPCQSCGKIFTNQKARMKHWHSHDQERPFPCSICYRRYGRVQHLRRHMKCHEEESKIPAASDVQKSQEQLAGKTPKKVKTANNKDKLLNVSYINSFCSTNLEVDEDEILDFDCNEVKCPQCNKSFATINGLNAHLVFHSNLHCPICKMEVTQNLFIKHILKHEGEGCYPCQSCGKIFSNPEKRMKHWHSHAQEKPFACTICFRRYGRLHHLRRHMKGHMEYDCNLCGATFKSVAEDPKPPHVCKKCKKSLKDISLTDGGEKNAAEEAVYKE
ncbi:zinc finger protein 667-like isoform X3 [Lucilia sericata]|uniref:zinc finger protein 667-like isoform X3 n=1 Tax=Lucilia sericata TaxID=13632 RepID=UPI0018A84969|nr:zinc finger protein 667-like isoform X3 [Lucilia sericata]